MFGSRGFDPTGNRQALPLILISFRTVVLPIRLDYIWE